MHGCITALPLSGDEVGSLIVWATFMYDKISLQSVAETAGIAPLLRAAEKNCPKSMSAHFSKVFDICAGCTFVENNRYLAKLDTVIK